MSKLSLLYHSAAACNIPSVITCAPERRVPKPILKIGNKVIYIYRLHYLSLVGKSQRVKPERHTNPGNRYILFAWFTCPTFPFPANTYMIVEGDKSLKSELNIPWFRMNFLLRGEAGKMLLDHHYILSKDFQTK